MALNLTILDSPYGKPRVIGDRTVADIKVYWDAADEYATGGMSLSPNLRDVTGIEHCVAVLPMSVGSGDAVTAIAAMIDITVQWNVSTQKLQVYMSRSGGAVGMAELTNETRIGSSGADALVLLLRVEGLGQS